MSWMVEIESGGNLLPWPSGVVADSPTYGESVQGGFLRAEIAATGPREGLWALLRWLGYLVRIRNAEGTAVWLGMIYEVTLRTEALEVGLSLDQMYNRIAVAYTTNGADGAAERSTTSWAEDAESIARYGYKELLHTAADVSASQATALRDTLLATLSKPRSHLSLEPGQAGATLRCMGLAETLGWRYYSQPAGVEEHLAGGQEQPLGQGLTAATMGFTPDGRIHDTGNRLDALPKGHNVQVTGSTSNNGAHLLDASGKDGATYTATTISFDPSDDISDSANGLNILAADDIITISGSASNNGLRRVKAAGAGAITVYTPPLIVTGAAGASVTIAQAGSVKTLSTFVSELPAATVTLTVHGQKVAQSFSLAANVSWTVDQIVINIKKTGAPADSVQVELCADSAGAPGTVLASATVAAASIYETMNWVAFDLGNTATISYGSSYWVVVSRTGANDIANYYAVDVDEGLGYSRGQCKLWTGASWSARATNADMAFRVLGAWETTRQIQEIYNACNQFFAAVDVVDSSGVYSLQYRAGDGTGWTEVEALANAGSSAGRRLLVSTTADRVLRVQLQELAGDNNLLLGVDGALRMPTGRMLPAGWLPTAQWVRLADVPGNVDALASLANIFIERAEWNNGRLRVEPQGAPSVWDLGQVDQG